jgi:predicted dehydrogenase
MPLREKIAWGILGTGLISHHFAEALRYIPDAQLFAVGSRNLTRAKIFAEQYCALRAYGSYEELVNDKDVNIVYVATPAQLHKDHCLLCLGAGKAVLCEKPFTCNAIEAEEVIAYAREKQLFCMEAMWMRFLPIMGKLLDLLTQDVIGDVRMVRADLGFVSFQKEHQIKPAPEISQGALLDLGVYPISLVFSLLGTPTQVNSQASVNSAGVDGQIAAIMSYENGKLAIVSASKEAALPGEALIVGTRGQIRIHAPLYRPHKLSISLSPPQGQPSHTKQSCLMRIKRNPMIMGMYFRFEGIWELLLSRRPQIIVEPFQGNGYNYEIVEVHRCLREGRCESKVMGLDETLNIMKTMDVIRYHWR